MGKWDIFSKRNKKTAEAENLYQYDDLPNTFRVQVSRIMGRALGIYYAPSPYNYGLDGHDAPSNSNWKIIQEALCDELGLYSLSSSAPNPRTDVLNFLLNTSTENALSVIEFSFRVVDRVVRKMYQGDANDSEISQTPDEAIDELNFRFLEHNIGYQYTEGILVKLDSELVHKEITEPAIMLLKNNAFTGALEEFLKAHEFYKSGEYKDSISWALKAFESTMKTICELKQWQYDKDHDTVQKLIEIIFANNLLPAYLTQAFNSLRSLLESTLPTVRNRTGGHGQGSRSVEIPPYFANFALNISACNIILLIKAFENSK